MKKLLISAIIGLTSLSAFADSHCTGKIGYLSVGRHATVLIQGPGGLPAVYLCNLTSKQNNIEPEACKAMYSTLLSAQAQDKAVHITFNPAISSCSSVDDWAWATNLNWVMAYSNE